MEIAPIGREAVDAMREVWSAHDERVRKADPRLPPVDAVRALRPIQEAIRSGEMLGWLAMEGGRPIAYLTLRMVNRRLEEAEASYEPLRYGELDFAAPDPRLAAPALYALYGAAADRLLRAGYFTHRARCPAEPRFLRELWADLGFGRESVLAAIRSDELPRRPARRPAGLVVRRAGREDAAIAERFAIERLRWHARPPLGRPFRRESVPAVLAQSFETAEGPNGIRLVAERDGEPVGWCEGLVDANTAAWSTCVDAPYAYLGNAMVAVDAQAGAVGPVLTAAFFEWARSHPFLPRYVYGHYQTANPAGALFWPLQGFRPLEYLLQRSFDATAEGLAPWA